MSYQESSPPAKTSGDHPSWKHEHTRATETPGRPIGGRTSSRGYGRGKGRGGRGDPISQVSPVGHGGPQMFEDFGAAHAGQTSGRGRCSGRGGRGLTRFGGLHGSSPVQGQTDSMHKGVFRARGGAVGRAGGVPEAPASCAGRMRGLDWRASRGWALKPEPPGPPTVGSLKGTVLPTPKKSSTPLTGGRSHRLAPLNSSQACGEPAQAGQTSPAGASSRRDGGRLGGKGCQNVGRGSRGHGIIGASSPPDGAIGTSSSTRQARLGKQEAWDGDQKGSMQAPRERSSDSHQLKLQQPPAARNRVGVGHVETHNCTVDVLQQEQPHNLLSGC